MQTVVRQFWRPITSSGSKGGWIVDAVLRFRCLRNSDLGFYVGPVIIIVQTIDVWLITKHIRIEINITPAQADDPTHRKPVTGARSSTEYAIPELSGACPYQVQPAVHGSNLTCGLMLMAAGLHCQTDLERESVLAGFVPRARAQA